jgi:hypothetical protein
VCVSCVWCVCRLDQLPFSAYHWFLVVSLGVTWMLDGLEVTVPPLPAMPFRRSGEWELNCALRRCVRVCAGRARARAQVVSVLSAHLKREDTLGLTDVQVGLTVSLTLLGTTRAPTAAGTPSHARAYEACLPALAGGWWWQGPYWGRWCSGTCATATAARSSTWPPPCTYPPPYPPTYLPTYVWLDMTRRPWPPPEISFKCTLRRTTNHARSVNLFAACGLVYIPWRRA